MTEYREGDRIIPIVLRAQEADRSTLDDLTDVTITTEDGKSVPLLQVAEFLHRGTQTLRHSPLRFAAHHYDFGPQPRFDGEAIAGSCGAAAK